MHLVFSFSVIHVYFFLPFKKKNEGISRQETSCVNLTRHFLRCAGAGRVSSVPKPTPPHPYFLYWWWYPKISWTHFNPSIPKNKKKNEKKTPPMAITLSFSLEGGAFIISQTYIPCRYSLCLVLYSDRF